MLACIKEWNLEEGMRATMRRCSASVLGREEVTTPRLCDQPRATAVGCSHTALFISPPFPGIPRLRRLRSE